VQRLSLRDSALRRAARVALATTDAPGPVAIIPFFDRRFQPQLDQPQQTIDAVKSKILPTYSLLDDSRALPSPCCAFGVKAIEGNEQLSCSELTGIRA
jgi:hypothetical protein